MRSAQIGYGAGSAEIAEQPNVLRITVGDAADANTAANNVAWNDRVSVIEANLDDMNPQIYGYFAEKALAAGALDVYATPVHMKKNRPGMLVTILCAPPDADRLADLLFTETTTIGVRKHEASRSILPREIVKLGYSFRRHPNESRANERTHSQCRAGIRRLPAHRHRTQRSIERSYGRSRLCMGEAAREHATNPMPTENQKPKFYITTPIYYTNGLPHIGHTYSTIVCDTIRRYKRMRGFDVVMTTGTDEHGVNVERSAQKAGRTPQDFVDEMAAQWRKIWDDFGIQGDEFIRTTDLLHAKTVQWLFQTVPRQWIYL